MGTEAFLDIHYISEHAPGGNGDVGGPLGWTSADAAGLAVLPGLVRYDEVAAGRIDHAIRMTVPQSRRAYLWPASHYASSSTDANRPAMGERFRLKATVDEADFPEQVRPIIVALKTHGAIVADNGSAWYMSGAPDERWDNDQLRTLNQIKGSDFVAVDGSGASWCRSTPARPSCCRNDSSGRPVRPSRPVVRSSVASGSIQP